MLHLIRAVRLIVVLIVVISFTPVRAAEFSQLTQDIQNKLIEFGYNPGSADGLFGGRTERAIRQFQTEFRLPLNGESSETTAAFLGVPGYKRFEDTQILVLNESSEVVGQKISSLDHADVINYIYDLEQSNRSKINTIFEHSKAVIFIINKNFQPGDIVFTYMEVTRLESRQKSIENLYYEITEDMSVEPLIIINEIEAGLELQFTHRVFLNGELIGEKRTRAAR